MNLNIDQRAFIVGEQGICPECEHEVDWKDINPSWYLCHKCVQSLIAGQPVLSKLTVIADLVESQEDAFDEALNVMQSVWTGDQGSWEKLYGFLVRHGRVRTIEHVE